MRWVGALRPFLLALRAPAAAGATHVKHECTREAALARWLSSSGSRAPSPHHGKQPPQHQKPRLGQICRDFQASRAVECRGGGPRKGAGEECGLCAARRTTPPPPAELHIGTPAAAQEAARKNNVTEAERLHTEYLEQGGKPMCVCQWSPACLRPPTLLVPQLVHPIPLGPAATVCKAHGKLDIAQTVP